MPSHSDHVGRSGVAAFLLALSTGGASAQACLSPSRGTVQPALVDVSGVQWCSALLRSYTSGCAPGSPGGVCLDGFRQALSDAGSYFKQAGSSSSVGFRIVLPAGVLDFRGDSSTPAGSTIMPMPSASATSATLAQRQGATP